MTPRPPIGRYDIKHVYSPSPPQMTDMQNIRAYGPVLPMQKEKKTWWKIWN